MRIPFQIIGPLLLTLLTLTTSAISTCAQDVSIPDPGLNAAIREALQKPVGPLTQQDLLSLNLLSACCRNISSIQGLEAARNLTILDLHANSLTNCVVPNSLTNLQIIDLFQNQLTSFAVPLALSNLTIVDVAFNALARCTLHSGLKNLDTLFLGGNQLTSFTLPAGLSRLTQLDLSANGLTTLNVPADMTNLTTLLVFANQLTNLNLSANLDQLSTLDLHGNRFRSITLPVSLPKLLSLDLSQNLIASFSLPPNLTSLSLLNLGLNGVTNVSLPNGLTNLTELVIRGNNTLADLNLPTGLIALETLDLEGNILNHVTLPTGMKHLFRMNLQGNQLFSLSLPTGMTNLATLLLDGNHLDSLALPADLTKLAFLELTGNNLTNLSLPGSLTALTELYLPINRLGSFILPSGLTNLRTLDLFENLLTSFALPSGLTALTNLDLGVNQLTRFSVPADAINLTSLLLSFNQLTNVNLPPGLKKLKVLSLVFNQLGNLDLPADLTALAILNLNNNQLASLTLPPDVQQLIGLYAPGNPLTTFVLSEILAATGMTSVVDAFRDQGIAVLTYPLAVSLVAARRTLAEAFAFELTGPPGNYAILGSADLITWNVLALVTNQLGSVIFQDVTANILPRKFYRALLQRPPMNMVFVPSNTFTMGSPTNEPHRWSNEGPQTTVTLIRGFWMGKYEVTQGDYLDVTGTNPSLFQGDLTRPVSSVSWPDATNYCWRLTQRELLAGRISPDKHYRLPTEAEWECAARAGTSTRFSYGDDPDYTNLPDYGWQSIDDGLTVHPVGRKFPNPWGLYDMYGNVLEWCQDWFGPLPGGSVTDPHGPPSSPVGDKIMRGGAFDFGGSFCRSASRQAFGSHPALNDWNLGFRVVLVEEQ